MKYIVKLLLNIYLIFHYISHAFALDTMDIQIYSETFGNLSNPAIILNAGAGNQSILWPDVFCNKLSTKGYFVIRYDYRDTGLSSEVDYKKNPYNVMDLANDAVGVLDKYNIKKAHFVGFSMGGQIAQLVGAYVPERALSLILISTSNDFTRGFDAFENILKKFLLFPYSIESIEWMASYIDISRIPLKKKMRNYAYIWKILDGSPKNFDEVFYRNQAVEVFSRTKHHMPYLKHGRAIRASIELHSKALPLIHKPTLILHGDKDPIFPINHANELKKEIHDSELIIIKNFAHAISPRNFDLLIDNIDNFIKQQSK